MPAPDPKILQAFFQLYKSHDKKAEDSEHSEKTEPNENSILYNSLSTIYFFSANVVSTAITTAKNGIALITGSVDDIIKKINSELESAHTKNAKQWIDFYFELAVWAEKAQGVKQLSGQSRLCLNIFGLMSEIRFAMTTDNDEYKKIFDETITNLVDEYYEDLENIGRDSLENNGKGEANLIKKSHETLKKLAYLAPEQPIIVGIRKDQEIVNLSISVAARHNLLKHLLSINAMEKHLSKQSILIQKNANEPNHAIPYSLQNINNMKFSQILYADRYQSLTCKSYADYLDEQVSKKQKNLHNNLHASNSSLSSISSETDGDGNKKRMQFSLRNSQSSIQETKEDHEEQLIVVNNQM